MAKVYDLMQLQPDSVDRLLLSNKTSKEIDDDLDRKWSGLSIIDSIDTQQWSHPPLNDELAKHNNLPR